MDGRFFRLIPQHPGAADRQPRTNPQRGITMDRNPNLVNVEHHHAEVKVVANVKGLDDVMSTTTITIQPERLIAIYVADHAGFWRCRSARLSGSRVLKPGPDGERRLGQMTHDREWYTFGFGSEDVARDHRSPAMTQPVRDLIESLRPAGVVKLPPRG